MFRKIFLAFVKLFLIFYSLFTVQRILFSFFYFKKVNEISFFEYLGVYFHSIRLDLGTGLMLSVLPLLIYIIYLNVNKKFVFNIFKTVLFFEIITLLLIHAGELNAYGEWNHKLTTRVFTHIVNPDEVYRSAEISMIIGFLFVFIIQLSIAYFLTKKFFIKNEDFQFSWKNVGVSLLSFLLFASSSVLALRGGLQQIPMNINASAYSNHAILNDISINSLYYFGNSYKRYKRGNLDNIIPVVDTNEAKRFVDSLYNYDKSQTEFILKTDKPNVILIILEGWAADAVTGYGNAVNSTPYFEKMAKQGVKFSNIYACSGTSEIGNSSIFSGLPAVPEISLTQFPDKYRKIGSFNQELQEQGYSSYYLFGGDLKYGNIGGYLLDQKFQKVKDEKDLPEVKNRGKLNYYDEDLYTFFKADVKQMKQPFLACAFTGSTHSPYDHPKIKNKRFNGGQAGYMNSLIYADSVMYQFVQSCKKESWYKNTLFVFVADHGHPNQFNENPHLNGYSRIPLMMFGEVIKEEYKGKQIDKIGSQSDLATTILTQLKLNTSRYPYSKDLFNTKSPDFALHTITNGFGWITKEGNFSYNLSTKIYMDSNVVNGDFEKIVKEGKLFLNHSYLYYKDL